MSPTTLTCKSCEATWSFEDGLTPPSDWEHWCTQRSEPLVTARTIEHWLPKVWKELKGKTTGSRGYLEGRSPTLKGAKLALDAEEYAKFVKWARAPQ
jgi:hypothetical protein